ncbi:hypothetical protein ACQ4PT_008150 [Festuca glaucescens]
MATAPSVPPLELYKPVPGEAQDTEAGVRGHRNDRLPCCGLGIGWVLFISSFFLTIPWYVGAVLLCFYREEKREKPGFIACTVAAVILTILIIVMAILDAVLVHY